MATDFNYQRDHSRAFYNLKGEIFWCHSKEDELRAKEQGFTNPNYVRSQWPKTAYHKKTGDSKPVGKLEWSDEQNAAALKSLGEDWTLGHVAVPEAAQPSEAKELGAADLTALASIMADQELLAKRIEDLEEAALQGDAVRVSLENRILELENEASAPEGEDRKKKK